MRHKNEDQRIPESTTSTKRSENFRLSRALLNFDYFILIWLTFYFNLFSNDSQTFELQSQKTYEHVQFWQGQGSATTARGRFCFWLGLNFRKFGYRWVPCTSEKKLRISMSTGYRSDKKIWVPGTSEKNFWVPMGTTCQKFILFCIRWTCEKFNFVSSNTKV